MTTESDDWTPHIPANVTPTEELEFYANLKEKPTKPRSIPPGIAKKFAKLNVPCVRCGRMPLIVSATRMWGEYQFCTEDCYIEFMDTVISNA